MKKLVGALAALVLTPLAAAAVSTPHILFDGNGDILVSALDGSARVSLTGGARLANGARWSPDGTRVAYATNRDTGGTGANEIYVANSDGTGITRLTFDGVAKASPVWSPDSTRVAFGEGSTVRTISATGGTPQVVATAPETVAPVAWAGTSILARGNTGAGRLYSISPADGSVRDFGLAQGPVFPPDAARIAFQDAAGNVAVMDADGTHARALTTMNSTSPAWIDDHTIAFTGNHVFLDKPNSKFGPPGRTNVYVVDVDTGEAPRRITDASDEFADPRPADNPQASADGAQIIFRWGYGSEYWRANVDGTCAQRIPLQAPEGGDGVYWQPGSAPGRTSCAELWVAPLPTVSPNPVALRAPATVTLRIENHGNETATGIVVQVTPKTPDAIVGRCSDCAIASLTPGASALVSYTLASRTAGAPQATAVVTAAQTSPAPQLATAPGVVEVLPCTLVGTTGADRLIGTAHADRICGLPGPDYISAGAGNDTIDSGNGDDVVYGGPGRDTITTRDGRDTIFARDGAPDNVDCGGQYDVVVADRSDVTRHCERVIRR